MQKEAQNEVGLTSDLTQMLGMVCQFCNTKFDGVNCHDAKIGHFEVVSASLKAKNVKMKNDRLEGTYVDEYAAVGGLTLRDYFAAKAMQSQLSQIDVDVDVNYGVVAKEAYLAADAMLSVRRKT